MEITFRLHFRFGFKHFSWQFHSAEVPPQHFLHRNCLRYVLSDSMPSRLLPNSCLLNPNRFLSTSDFQSEVGEVFGEIGGELPAKFGGRFSSFLCWGKLSEAFSTKIPP